MQNLIDKLQLSIWGRDLEISVEYDCYRGEEVTEEQKAALNYFLSQKGWIDDAKQYVEDFCKNRVLEDAENNKKDNIFSYIKPESLFIKRDRERPRVALMCKYRYDLEHGLAVVFTADGEITVGIQDIIL